jgi:hypothetical protein
VSKVVLQCSCPLIDIRCAKRIYGDLITPACTSQVLQLINKVDGLEYVELERLVGTPLV